MKFINVTLLIITCIYSFTPIKSYEDEDYILRDFKIYDIRFNTTCLTHNCADCCMVYDHQIGCFKESAGVERICVGNQGKETSLALLIGCLALFVIFVISLYSFAPCCSCCNRNKPVNSALPRDNRDTAIDQRKKAPNHAGQIGVSNVATIQSNYGVVHQNIISNRIEVRVIQNDDRNSDTNMINTLRIQKDGIAPPAQ